MWMEQHSKGQKLLAPLIALACLVSSQASVAAQSRLSAWLSDSALAEIRTLASGHPRVAQRSLHVSARGNTALDDAIVTTVQKSLGRLQQLQLIVPAATSFQPSRPAVSVDDVSCDPGPAWDNELQIMVGALDRDQVEVRLDLVDTAAPGVAFRSWRWQGSLNSAERKFLARPARHLVNDGSLSAPWTEAELEQAGAELSRQLACSLRPDIVSSLTLQWPQQQTIPAPLASAVNEARRRIDYYREISESREAADYQLHAEWLPLADQVWQLSLAATPQSAGVAGIHVATYIRATLTDDSGSTAYHSPPAIGSLPEFSPGQPASQYLQVQMLDVSQSDSGLARADLQVRLRLVNRADRPLEYGLSLSGGHYLQCIPEPRYYRHDRYAYTEGRLAPGQSIVRVLEIEGARHNPNPLFGTARCAGFKGLEGLEDFANEGHKVTQFIRWSL